MKLSDHTKFVKLSFFIVESIYIKKFKLTWTTLYTKLYQYEQPRKDVLAAIPNKYFASLLMCLIFFKMYVWLINDNYVMLELT